MSALDEQDLSRLLSVLSDARRRFILSFLAETGGASVNTIVRAVAERTGKISQPTVSCHLRDLRDVRLVCREQRGQHAAYTVCRLGASRARDEICGFLDRLGGGDSIPVDEPRADEAPRAAASAPEARP